ncbi:MAG: YfhO family protein, partial [Candidatus Binatia bacterium]
LVDGLPSDAPTAPVTVAAGDRWNEHHIALARAGESRRVRLRIVATTQDGAAATVSLGDLGFGPGAAVEARLGRERLERHLSEAAALRRVFDDPTEGVAIYENTNVLPRAFRVRRVEPTGSTDGAFTRLGDGFDFRTAALVDRHEIAVVEAALEEGGAEPSTKPLEGSTTIRNETPGTVTIDTDGPTPALLVLADLAYPGWRAEIDGHAVPVRTTDGVLRGVVVPAGAHVVTFGYRPMSLLIGAAISVLALVALVPYGRASARQHRDGIGT